MRPGIARSMTGGLVGTILITLMMYGVAPIMMGMRMDIAQMLGSMLGGSWTLGMVMHFVNGTVIFPLIYAYLLYQFLPGPPTVKGMTWGVILWFLAQAIVMPVMGGGFFSAEMGGMMAVMGSLVGHLVYGASLGLVAGEATHAPMTPVHAR